LHPFVIYLKKNYNLKTTLNEKLLREASEKNKFFSEEKENMI